MLLHNRYAIEDPLDRTATATLYRGRDTLTDRVVAIKLVQDVYTDNPTFGHYPFCLEPIARSHVEHPNIVQVFDYGQDGSSLYLILEFVEGTTLFRHLHEHTILSIDQVVSIASAVALGLGAAHRHGIIHGDVQPRNILLCRDGTSKLTNFMPVIRNRSAESYSLADATLGTVQYYAPDQAFGELISPAADVYALGCVLYEMLTGHAPFVGETPMAVALMHMHEVPASPRSENQAISPQLEAVILRCLEKAPEMRFRNGSQLARSLEAL